METVTHDRTTVVLPCVEDDRQPLSALPLTGKVSDYVFAQHQLRQLAVTDGDLLNGHIVEVNAERVTLNQVRIESARIDNCVLQSAQLVDCLLSRVVFTNCKILGARFSDNSWSNVIFDGCRIEYADLEAVEAAGPVVFVNTTLNDVTFTRCAFPGGAITDCDLRTVEFDGGNYDQCDLRGTDLTAARGVSNLNGALITPDQRYQLAEALVSELHLRYPEDEA